MKKMSYVAVVTDVLNGVALTDEHIERLEALRDSLAKRSSSRSGKPTKAQIANEKLGNEIINAMSVGENYTIADIKGLVPDLAEATPQKISPLLKIYGVNTGKVVRETVKGKAVYHLA